jgi:hypothetical protein
MKYRMPSCSIAFLLAVLAVSVAGQAQSIALAPGQVRQTFKPGVPFEIELASANQGDEPVEMSVQITDLWYNEKNEKTFSSPGSSPRSAANWIQFVPEHFEIPAHGTQKMHAVVTPPADAHGGYYAVLFVQSVPKLTFDKTKDGKTIFTNVRVGCLVMLSAEKTEDYKIGLSNLNLIPLGSNRSLDLTFDVENDGNVHVFPVARMAVIDAGRKLVAKAESEPKRLLPGQKDSMHVGWTGNLPAGDYTAVLTVAYGDDRIETRQIPLRVTGQ